MNLQRELYYKIANNIVRNTVIIMLLELLEVLETKGRYITNNLVTLGFNNRKIHRKIMNNNKNASEYTQDLGVEIAKIN